MFVVETIVDDTAQLRDFLSQMTNVVLKIFQIGSIASNKVTAVLFVVVCDGRRWQGLHRRRMAVEHIFKLQDLTLRF
jgi:hypothetical protein